MVKSPCLNCDRVDEDKNKCLESCEKIKEYQEKLVQLLLAQRDRLSIDVFHIGSKPYSFFSGKAFNALFSNNPVAASPTAGAIRGNAGRVKVVAEITTNHFGDRTRLEAMIRAAWSAGADYIKLQRRDVSTFYTREELSRPYTSPYGDTFSDYRHGIELDREDFAFVADLCRSLALGWIVSVLDRPSFEFVQEFQPDLIKLPSTISEHRDFLGMVAASYEGALVISTGFTDQAYERFLLETFVRASRIYLLQCTSAYPAPLDHAQIGVVRHYYNLGKTDPRIIPGYSSHDIGSLCSMMMNRILPQSSKSRTPRGSRWTSIRKLRRSAARAWHHPLPLHATRTPR
jgi:N-acetylneuraminate synthase